MAEYIDREALISWLKKAGWFLKIEVDHKRVCHVIGKIIDHIEAIPTADVAEVVRCKNCKFFTEYPGKYAERVEHADGECWRKYFYSHNAQFSACEYNDFCSQGRRKDGE